jgi:cysteinyl-tRNA synthetase
MRIPLVLLALVLLSAPPAAEAQVRAQGKELTDKKPEPALTSSPPKAPANFRQILREMAIEMANAARKVNPRFIVLMRDGLALMTKDKWEGDLEDLLDPKGLTADSRPPVGAFQRPLARALDGVVEDGLFCGRPQFDQPSPEDERRERLAIALPFQDMGKRLFTLDYCQEPRLVAQAYAQAERAGAIAYVDTGSRARLAGVAIDRPVHENPNHVTVLKEARNLIALLDTKRYPAKKDALLALGATNYDLLLVPVQMGPNQEPLEVVRIKGKERDDITPLKLKRLGTTRKVLATLPMTMAEIGRYYWKPEWRGGDPAWLTAEEPGNPDRFVVAYWDPGWKEILSKYLADIMGAGFDGIVLDEMGAWRHYEAINPLD